MATTFDLGVIFRMIDKLSVPMAAMQKKLDKFSAKVTKIGKEMENVGKTMTTFATLPILGLGAAMIRTAGQFEQYQASFEVLLGSQEKGKKLFDEITQMAAKTPFELSDLASSTQMMLNFGISSDVVLENLHMLGDIAGTDKNKLKSLTLAFSQMSSTGRLMGQDLLQMVNAGFNPLQIISEKTGKTMGELKDLMEKGAISTEMVTAAFKVATSEGGRFYKNMDVQSKTFFGKWSTMMDSLKLMLKSFGDILLPIATKVIEKLTKIATWFGNLSDKTKKTILIILAVIAVIGPLIFILGKLLVIVGMVGKAFSVLSFFLTPTGLIVLGVIAAIIALVAIILNWGKITKWFSGVWQKLLDFFDRMPRIFKIILGALFPFITIPILIVKNWNVIKTFFGNILTWLWNLFDNFIVKVIVNAIAPFIALPIEIIKNWGAIADFFGALWNGIVNAFIKAIDFIKDIWANFTSWAMKNPILKWLFEVKPKKPENKAKEKEIEKKLNEEEKKKSSKSLLNMDSFFKNFKSGSKDKNTVFVNVKVTAENGAIATIDQVKTAGNTKKKIVSDSNYTGLSWQKG